MNAIKSYFDLEYKYFELSRTLLWVSRKSVVP